MKGPGVSVSAIPQREALVARSQATRMTIMERTPKHNGETERAIHWTRSRRPTSKFAQKKEEIRKFGSGRF